MRNITGKPGILLSVMLLCMGLAVSVNAQSYQPAGFGDVLPRIQSTVKVPELTSDSPVVSVYCQADIATTGESSAVQCYEKDGFESLRRDTEKALTGQNFEPARIDDDAVPVRMHFRVVYSQRAGQDPILLLPNLGNMQSQYGPRYIAPQERLDSTQWYAQYRRETGGSGQAFFNSDGVMTRIIAQVDKTGRVRAVRRIEAHEPYQREAIVVETALKKSRFLPGMADGKSQTMQYVAVLNYDSKD